MRYEESGRAERLALRKTLESEGVKIADKAEVPRFEFLENLATVPAAMSAGAPKRDENARFRRRLIFP